MLGMVARGTYVLVLTAMIVTWVFSFNKEIPVAPQSDQVIWYIHT